jgi:hypothetical protein
MCKALRSRGCRRPVGEKVQDIEIARLSLAMWLMSDIEALAFLAIVAALVVPRPLHRLHTAALMR